MKTELCEQETTINLYPSALTEWADYYTCIPSQMRQLRKLAASNPDDVIIEKEDEIGIFAQVKASWFQMRRPRKPRRLTEEQIKANAAQLKAAREARNG